MLCLSKLLAWAENPKPNAHMATIKVENSFPAMLTLPHSQALPWDMLTHPHFQGPL